MRATIWRGAGLGFLFTTLLSSAAPAPAAAQGGSYPKETDCSNRIDDDGDGLIDCADADCFGDPACKTAGGLENSDLLCSDWIDNDGDGAVDCEDVDCHGPGLTACKGSWEGPLEGTGVSRAPRARLMGDGDGDPNYGMIPALGEGMSVEDLLGKGGDADGERNDFVCADGIDNDGDGAIDCADLGCRFDPNVTVCRGTPGVRFGLAAHVAQSYEFETREWDTRVNRLQLRAFGPIPFLQDSFFLISIRAERAPRLTFAMFSTPVPGMPGHYININSGGGGLSNGLVLSVSKNILLDPPFYLFSAFEQGNGAAVEMNGPLIPGYLDYRVFTAGGSGRFTGNIGGRFFSGDERNYTWGVGAQVAYYAFGRFDRWDTRFLYVPVPAALTVYLGGRYDQREFERFPAANVNFLFRWKRLLASVEGYGKREFNFGSWQFAYNVQAGFLLIPKYLFLAADIGQFYASDFEKPLPELVPTELRRLVDELQWRVALHTYVWRNTGVVTLLYTDRFQESSSSLRPDLRTKELRLETQFRF